MTHCPFCARPLHSHITIHCAKCPHNPAMAAAYAAALADPEKTGHVRKAVDYDATHSPELFGADALRDNLGMTWAQVAEHFNLQPVPRTGGRKSEARAERQRQAQAQKEEAPPLLPVRDYGDGFGLPIGSVREVVHAGRVYEYMMVR